MSLDIRMVYNKGTLLLLLLVLLTLSCAPARVTYTENDIASHQKRWLSKAYRYDKDGWVFVHIEGGPFERGFQRGYLTADETDKMFKTFTYITEFGTGRDIDFFVRESEKLFKGKVSPEYIEEMQGMAAGVRAAGKDTTYEQILFMNGFIDIMWYWYPTVEDTLPDDEPGCSAFIATGDATMDGRIVMAHNTWSGYTLVQFCNIAVEIVPDKGNRMLMQSWGPSIYSMTDFFITSAGLVGTETTIGGFNGFNAKGKPVFERARKAMQYAGNIDEWANIMIEDNSGAYANSWLIGNVNTGEIACLELGLKFHSLQKKINGYFTGSNVTEDIKILRRETRATYDDLRSSAVARRVRWEQLMKKHYGKIDVETAKKMLADHYDVYLKKENPSSRTICGHWELEDGRIPASGGPWRPSGTIDGKVVDSQMAKSRHFWARWGSSCGRNFDANDFLAEHPQYNRLEGFLPNLPVQPWIILPMKK